MRVNDYNLIRPRILLACKGPCDAGPRSHPTTASGDVIKFSWREPYAPTSSRTKANIDRAAGAMMIGTVIVIATR